MCNFSPFLCVELLGDGQSSGAAHNTVIPPCGLAKRYFAASQASKATVRLSIATGKINKIGLSPRQNASFNRGPRDVVRACSQKRALVVRRPMQARFNRGRGWVCRPEIFFLSSASFQRVFGAKAMLVAAICYGLQGSVGFFFLDRADRQPDVHVLIGDPPDGSTADRPCHIYVKGKGWQSIGRESIERDDLKMNNIWFKRPTLKLFYRVHLAFTEIPCNGQWVPWHFALLP